MGSMLTRGRISRPRVRAGAVLLLSGPFADNEHFHDTASAQSLGLPTEQTKLQLRNNSLDLPLGKGKVLFRRFLSS